MHGFLLLFLKLFCIVCGLFWSPFPRSFLVILPLYPRNLCLAAVVRLGGNGFSGYRDWGNWDPFTPRSFID